MICLMTVFLSKRKSRGSILSRSLLLICILLFLLIQRRESRALQSIRLYNAIQKHFPPPQKQIVEETHAITHTPLAQPILTPKNLVRVDQAVRTELGRMISIPLFQRIWLFISSLKLMQDDSSLTLLVHPGAEVKNITQITQRHSRYDATSPSQAPRPENRSSVRSPQHLQNSSVRFYTNSKSRGL